MGLYTIEQEKVKKQSELELIKAEYKEKLLKIEKQLNIIDKKIALSMNGIDVDAVLRAKELMAFHYASESDIKCLADISEDFKATLLVAPQELKYKWFWGYELAVIELTEKGREWIGNADENSLNDLIYCLNLLINGNSELIEKLHEIK